jgi:hypothetical protein
MDDALKERWSKSFLDQEEAVENLARMASVVENRCFAAFGEATPVGKDWEDALFTIRHLASMIDRFRDDYFAAIREDIMRSPAPVGDDAIEGAARTRACERDTDNNIGLGPRLEPCHTPFREPGAGPH